MDTLLKNLKKNKQQYIDTVSEKIRMQYITPGFGQMLVYKEKYEEATDYVVNDYPEDLNPYPLILAEVKATKASPKQIVDNILHKQSIWINKSAQIEEIRIKAKNDIEHSQSKEQIDDIVNKSVIKLKTL